MRRSRILFGIAVQFEKNRFVSRVRFSDAYEVSKRLNGFSRWLSR